MSAILLSEGKRLFYRCFPIFFVVFGLRTLEYY